MEFSLELLQTAWSQMRTRHTGRSFRWEGWRPTEAPAAADEAGGADGVAAAANVVALPATAFGLITLPSRRVFGNFQYETDKINRFWKQEASLN